MGVGRPSAWASVRVDTEQRTVLGPKAAIADLLGANRSWLSSLNVPPVDGKLYDVRTIARLYTEYREGVGKRAGERAAVESDDLRELKAERLRLTNERVALQNKTTRGELVSIHELGVVWMRTFTAFRSALEVIPRKIAAVVGMPRAAEHECKQLIDQALRDLSDLDLGDAGDPVPDDVDPSTTSAAESDAEPMG